MSFTADENPRLNLLIDENVPASVAEFFASRGHNVRFVRDLLPAGTADPVVATIGDKLSAIVVTWDRDFDKLAESDPQETAPHFDGSAGSASGAMRSKEGGCWRSGST